MVRQMNLVSLHTMAKNVEFNVSPVDSCDVTEDFTTNDLNSLY